MFAEERSTFEGHLKDNWTTTAIAYDNVPFQPGTAPFIRVTIVGGAAQQETLGDTAEHSRVGVCIIQVFVKAGTGTATISDYADTLCDMFRSVQLGNILCFSPYPQRVGDDGRGWYQINVNIPFENKVIK